jgi:hypothetical protein
LIHFQLAVQHAASEQSGVSPIEARVDRVFIILISFDSQARTPYLSGRNLNKLTPKPVSDREAKHRQQTANREEYEGSVLDVTAERQLSFNEKDHQGNESHAKYEKDATGEATHNSYVARGRLCHCGLYY